MKLEKKYNIIFALLAVLYIMTPLVIVMGSLCGYNCTMRGRTAFIVIIMLLSVVISCSIFIFKPKSNKLSIFITAALFIASIVNFFAFREHMVLACISVVATLVIFATRLPRTVAFIMSTVMSLLMVMLIFFISALGLFGTFGSNEVYREVYSPGGKYTAKIVINDQGALGGSTVVMLKNNEDIKNILLYHLEKKEIKLYSGKYSEYASIIAEWQSDNVLLINGEEYIIEKSDNE